MQYESIRSKADILYSDNESTIELPSPRKSDHQSPTVEDAEDSDDHRFKSYNSKILLEERIPTNTQTLMEQISKLGGQQQRLESVRSIPVPTKGKTNPDCVIPHETIKRAC